MIPPFFGHWGLPVLAFGIPAEVLWPYFAAAATLAIGLPFLPGQQMRRARGLDKMVPLGPLLVAIPMAVFGADHLTEAKFVAMVVPPFMPWRLFWAYFVGVALLAAALSLATTIAWRLAAALLGGMIFLFVLLIHIPNWLHAPTENFRLTLLLRDLALSAGILAFAASRKTRGTALGMPSRSEGLGSRLTAVARFLVALPIAIFGIDQFRNPAFAPGIPQDDPSVLITLPAWIPAHAVWAYIVGAVFIGCAAGLVTRRYARLAAEVLGITTLAVVLAVYVPLTVAKASDIANGLNYLAIHLALAGAAFLLAGSLPSRSSQAAMADVR